MAERMSSGQFRDKLMVMYPGLRQTAATRLASAAMYLVSHPAQVARLTDDELLSVRNFGPSFLAEFRAVCPSPHTDPWVEHALMVAGADRG